MKTKIFIFLFLWTALLNANTDNGNFQIVGSKIIDPDGNEFIPRGVNVQGMKYGWPGDVVPQADLIINAWNFNFIRVGCRLYDHYWNGQNVSDNSHYQTIESMQAIVDAFTPHKVVVKFEFHDRTGNYYTGSELEDLKDAFREMSDRWGDNPYVWFNIMNEPGGSSSNMNQWVNMHREVIEVIRDEKQVNNVIVIDAHYWGQDVGAWNANPVPEGNSSILSRGKDLIHFNDKTYENIMFSFHIYDQWNRGTPEQIEFKMHDYITRVKEKGLALMVGEFGTSSNVNQSLHFPAAFRAAMNVAPAHGIGLVWWHWFGGDALKLTTSGNGNGGNINSTTNPTNLTWPGQMIWDYSNFDGNREPFVNVYQPTQAQELNAGTNLTVKMAAADYDFGIKEVHLYVNDQLKQTFTEEPYEYTLQSIEAGRYNFKAVAVDSADVESTSTVISIDVASSPSLGSILYVTGDSPLTKNEDALYNQILKSGYSVVHRYQDDARVLNANNRVAVVISSSVTNTSVGSLYVNTPVPVLVGKPQFFPAMKLTGEVAEIDFGLISNENQVSVSPESHVITDGFTGTIEVYDNPAGIAYGNPASGAEVLMTATDDNEKATLFVFRSNTQLTDMDAPAARAGWYAQTDDGVELTDTSLEIFERLLEWLSANPVGIDQLNGQKGHGFQLRHNYPNPVRDITTIPFQTHSSGNVRLTVVDQMGAVMEVLVDEFKTPGSYSVDFQPSGRYAKGIYYYKLELNNEYEAKPMLLQ